MTDGDEMKAAVLSECGSIDVRRVQRPSPERDEVLVRVGTCGVCKSDYHVYEGTFPIETPVVLGHESAGEVVAVGDEVTAAAVGDRVALDPVLNCGYCEFCKRGRTTLCENLIASGGTADEVRDGSFAEYVAVPQQAVERIGDLPFHEAALAEPYGCCIHAVDRADSRSGDHVAIVGAGPIGLLLLQEFDNRGAGRIVVSEPVDERRERALDVGADAVVDPTDSDPVAAVHELLGTVDVAAEVVGLPDTIEQAHAMTTKGGTTLIVGVPPQNTTIEVDPFEVFYRETDIVGTYAGTGDAFRRAVAGLQNGRIDVDSLVTGQFSLDELEEVFGLMERTEGLKNQVVP